ncbi:MAG: hypothetical protein LUD51_07485 [Clostridia bacterium]|nr:hypothetical protein [Clostridia bacterium]
MSKFSNLYIAAHVTDEELEDIKGFVKEITGLIDRHYHYETVVNYRDITDIKAMDMCLADWTYVIISSRPLKKDYMCLEDQVRIYRESDGDSITSYVADEVIGKQVRARMKDKRSLEAFTSLDALKLQLYYDICAETELGGLKIASTCYNGRVSICGEQLETVDASGTALYRANEENAKAMDECAEAQKKYEDLRDQYESRKNDAEYLKEYVAADRGRLVARAALESRENVISEVMTMNSALRRAGVISDDYRIGYTLFLQGDCVKAYTALRRCRSRGMSEWRYATYIEFLGAIRYLEMRMLPLMPKPLYLYGSSYPLDADYEARELLARLGSASYGKAKMYPLTYFTLTQLAARSKGRYGGAGWLRDDVKKQLNVLKKAEGDNRYAMFQLNMMLVNIDLDAENTRTTKLYLDRALALIQDLSREYGGVYDMYVGDTYATYSLHYSYRNMFEEMQDMLFCAADRYKNCVAAEPRVSEAAHRLAKTYRTLSRNYALSGSMEHAREYFEKSADRFEMMYDLDRIVSLQNTAELYEDFAEKVKQEEGGHDVGESEDFLLRALKAYKELASILPGEFLVPPGLMYDKLGSIFRSAGEYDEGMDYFRSAEAEYKKDIAALGDIYNPLLAKCYTSMFAEPQMKDIDEALEKLKWAVDVFGKAAEDDPGFYTPEIAEAWRMLARAQRVHGDTDKAIDSHIKAMTFYDACERVTDNSVCYVSDIACELSDIADLYDKDKATDEYKADRAEEFHLQAIGTAYCGDTVGLPDMGNTLQNVTTSYVLSLLHPGFNALIALLYRYMSNTLGDDTQDLADKVADFSDTRPDMSEEDDYVVSQMLEAAQRCRDKAKENEDANLFLLGAYYALSSQYESMDNEKEAKKYARKAKKLFNDKYAPREEDLENWDEYEPGDGSELDSSSLEDIRKALGEDVYDALVRLFGMDPSSDADSDDSDKSYTRSAPGSKRKGKGRGRAKPADDADDFEYYEDDDDSLGIDFEGGAGETEFGDEPDDTGLMDLLKSLFEDNAGEDLDHPVTIEPSKQDEEDSVEKFIKSLEMDPDPDKTDGDLS